MNSEKLVSLITFHRAINFGAVLQCYALQQAVASLGYRVQVIDYVPFYVDRSELEGSDLVQFNSFEKYRKDFLNITDREFTGDDLADVESDVFVAGSDQVWNERISFVRKNVDAYFLNFAGPGSRRISYAASTGGTRLERGNLVDSLSRFDSLSVRENSLKANLSELELDSTLVPDPTLLCESYPEKEVNLPFSGDYIAIYLLQITPFADECIKRVKEHYGLPIVNMSFDHCISADYDLNEIDPSEWVWIIKRSKFFVTNSFHGSAFSVIYKKDFAVIPLESRNKVNKFKRRIFSLVKALGFKAIDLSFDFSNPKNDRFYTLLGRLDLSSRIVTRYSDLELILQKKVKKTSETDLSSLREEGIDFLRESIK
ncbi:hypothetical protein SIN8267_02965 [Sinobacterium norvegicum]|uniref:Polysaccharide pyruvyl transferase domain-containing protein n=1 Tax=Sinobacterium norvegicum TaxID=1641715 RepID=A0ABM9AIE9_9GAMM|nr:polysaccharide pyruvyl transferase family protein [Sinobacterium norvegicum]CAH0992828.1 hypothetical protein SIN8267_02965 [Sinobacterium norvegicum]